MPSIKFSHRYGKLGIVEDGKAVLIEVLKIDLKDLHQQFLNYDTDYGKYKLPKRGKYLMLMFMPHDGRRGIFTTLRAAYPAYKELYYRQNIGNCFDIVVADDTVGA